MRVCTEHELCDCLETTCIYTTRLTHVYEDIDNFLQLRTYTISATQHSATETTSLLHFTGTSFTVHDVYFQYFLSPI